MSTIIDLYLEQLHEQHPNLTQEICAFYAQACIVAFTKSGHTNGTPLQVIENTSKNYRVRWSTQDAVNEAGWRSINVVTEFGAIAIAMLLVHAETDFMVIRQSNIGTGVDYYLASKPTETTDGAVKNFLADVARLEVSGIFKEEGTNIVQNRLALKRKQVSKSNASGLPTMICIVEFSVPKASFNRYD